MDQVKHWFSSSYQSPFFFLLLFFPLVFIIILNYLKRSTKRPNLPPSPPKLPIIGNLHQMGRLPHRSLGSLSERYGPLILLKFGSFPTLIVSSAEVAEEIMKTHDLIFSNKPYLRAASDFMYGGHDVVFSPYGEYWRQAKKICVIQLLSQKMVRSLQSLREEEIAEMLESIELSRLNRSPVNFNELFYTAANNMMFRSAVGDGPEGKAFGKAYLEVTREVHELAGSICFSDLFPWLEWVDSLTGLKAGIQSAFKKLDKFMDRLIEHGIKSHDAGDGKKGFVHVLLQLQRDGKLDINLQRKDIKGILQSVFSGATDTVPSTLEWIMAEMVKNPSVMAKAQHEVRRVVGKKGKINEREIEQMQYLNCVLKEALRLHPFGLFPRETREAVKLSGYDIPPKTRVIINNWAIQRDPRLWEDPEKFIPERFEEVQMDIRGQHASFIPLGFGRRSCPGSAYAFTFAENVIANLLYWYDWELPGGLKPENLDMTENFARAIYKKDPLRLVPLPPRIPVDRC